MLFDLTCGLFSSYISTARHSMAHWSWWLGANIIYNIFIIGWLAEDSASDPYDFSPADLWILKVLLGHQIPHYRPPPNIWRVIYENIEYVDNGASQ